MDIRGAAIDGVHQYLVDEFDDRGIVDTFLAAGTFCFIFLAGDDFKVIQTVVARQIRQTRVLRVQ